MGEYFPGTGDLRDIGAGRGKYYAVDFPMRDGIDDECYQNTFVPIISKGMECYQPSAIVLQCGADSLSGDRLGCFNVTVKGHAKCLEFMKKYNLPLMLLGGGGYTIRNVARCWTYETAVALGTEIANELPYNDYFEYFGPDFKLHISPSNMTNQNTPEYMDKRNPPELKDKQIEPDNEFDGRPGKSGDRDEIRGDKDLDAKKDASKDEPMDVDDVKSEDKKESATVEASS